MNKNNHYYDYTPLTIHYWDQAKQIIEMKREGNNEKKNNNNKTNKITNDHNCKIE